MQRNKIRYTIFTIAIILVVITIGGLIKEYNSTDNIHADSEIAASINGENIYVEDIKRVLSEYDTTENITFESILNNSINEILVVQYGKNEGYSASEEEIDQRELFLKNNMPNVYEEISNRGLEQYRENLKNLIIYNKSIENYWIEHYDQVHVTENEALEWYKKNISDDDSNFEKNKEIIISSLTEEKKNILLDTLVETLKDESNIIIYKVN